MPELARLRQSYYICAGIGPFTAFFNFVPELPRLRQIFILCRNWPDYGKVLFLQIPKLARLRQSFIFTYAGIGQITAVLFLHMP